MLKRFPNNLNLQVNLRQFFITVAILNNAAAVRNLLTTQAAHVVASDSQADKFQPERLYL
jgi:hypothetical protein